jgi:hypothetical protein
VDVWYPSIRQHGAKAFVVDPAKADRVSILF